LPTAYWKRNLASYSPEGISLPLDFERALVTGGAGFIGSHLVDRLLQENCQVTVVDDLSSGSKVNLSLHEGNKKLRFKHASVLDTSKLKEAIKDCERVFHEAAIVSSEFATQNPLQTSEVNVYGTLNLLETARQHDLEHLIYASSAAVYGASSNPPVNEEAPTRPLSPYGASKLSAELFVQAYFSTYGLRTTALRYFNVYGPRQVQNLYSGVITIFLQRLNAGRSLEIQGDGEQTRDFIYVSDVAEANLIAASTKEAAGQVFNIATGKPTSINQLADTLGIVTGINTTRKRIPPRQGDIRFSYASTKRAENILGFKAKISFEEGIKRYVNWLKQA
jgi:nucleoside-diphosphate-sugar epimerase